MATDREEAGFLASIGESPEDRTAQFVYADWLDERDRPRGSGLAMDRSVPARAVLVPPRTDRQRTLLGCPCDELPVRVVRVEDRRSRLG